MSARATMIRLGVVALGASLLYFMLRSPAPVPEAPRSTADPFAFVRSMEGTRPDGNVRQGKAGQLVVDAELGHLFDYYLAALGEKDLPAIRSEIERELDRRLAPAAASEGKRLLGRYLDYKRALADLEKSLPASSDVVKSARARLTAMQQLRTRFFSPAEIQGLFGNADAYDLDALARLEIARDSRLTDRQRADKLAALDRRLSPAAREDREAPVRIVKLEATARELRERGASDDDIYRLRAAALSPEAANRLAQLDREEADWKRRIDAYLAQRRQLAAGGAGLQQLRDQLFTVEEQKRLGAYEQGAGY